MQNKHLIAGGCLVLLWLAESWLPFFQDLFSSTSARLRHDAKNFLFGGINSALSAVLLAFCFVHVEEWAAAHEFGLLRQFDLPTWLQWGAAILLLDLWMYWWHRLNHVVPMLWRFHRTHHSDPGMDASTGVRFHTGEILLSWLARAAVVPLLGVSAVQLVGYESLLLPVVLFHHSNVRLPQWFDFGLMPLVVTPAMHRVHHSHIVRETNSNYGSLTPWWDVLFRSLRVRRDTENIVYGLVELSSPRWQTLGGMVRTPLGETMLTRDDEGAD